MVQQEVQPQHRHSYVISRIKNILTRECSVRLGIHYVKATDVLIYLPNAGADVCGCVRSGLFKSLVLFLFQPFLFLVSLCHKKIAFSS